MPEKQIDYNNSDFGFSSSFKNKNKNQPEQNQYANRSIISPRLRKKKTTLNDLKRKNKIKFKETDLQFM